MKTSLKIMTHVMLAMIGVVTVGLKYGVVITLKQQEDYNHFADGKRISQIPNFWNVLSNIIFICGGIYQCITQDSIFGMLCVSVGLGSSYYHFNPTIKTLLWDRLPMALSFTYLIALKLQLNAVASLLFMAYGAWTVIYWSKTMDLSYYLALQLAPIIFFMLYSEYNMKIACILYIAAKICEDYDHELYYLTHRYFSGHELKHYLAGVALFFI